LGEDEEKEEEDLKLIEYVNAGRATGKQKQGNPILATWASPAKNQQEYLQDKPRSRELLPIDLGRTRGYFNPIGR
jgi:hypothetical protein